MHLSSSPAARIQAWAVQTLLLTNIMSGGKTYYVYILASQRNGTLYVGFTHSLLNRISEHKNNKYCGFTQKYNVKRLVYFEIFNDPNTAILREKTIKHWPRKKKISFIEKNNSVWRDLYWDVLKAAQ